MHHAPTAFLAPFAHVRHIKQAAVRHRLHTFTLAPGATVHTGGDLQLIRRKIVLGIQHLAKIVGLQRAAVQLRLAVRQPQRGVHNVQIVVQQSETQIVRPNAIRTVLIHTYRRC